MLQHLHHKADTLSASSESIQSPSLADMTAAELEAAIEALKPRERAVQEQSSKLHKERTAIEAEQARRNGVQRGEVFLRMVANESFSTHFNVRTSLLLRVPDSDWVDYGSEADGLRSEAGAFDDGQMVLGGHVYLVCYPDNYIQVRPMDSSSKAAWRALVDAVLPRLDRFGTAFSLETAAVIGDMLRTLPPEPAE